MHFASRVILRQVRPRTDSFPAPCSRLARRLRPYRGCSWVVSSTVSSAVLTCKIRHFLHLYYSDVTVALCRSFVVVEYCGRVCFSCSDRYQRTSTVLRCDAAERWLAVDW